MYELTSTNQTRKRKPTISISVDGRRRSKMSIFFAESSAGIRLRRRAPALQSSRDWEDSLGARFRRPRSTSREAWIPSVVNRASTSARPVFHEVLKYAGASLTSRDGARASP